MNPVNPMNRLALAALLCSSLSATPFALSAGLGVGHFAGSTSDAKTNDRPYEFGAPAFGLKVVDPSGSLLSFLAGVSGNYGRMKGAQDRAAQSADGTATYEMRTSVNSTGSTQTLEVLWATGGSYTSTAPDGRKIEDTQAELTAVQASLNAQLAAWNGLGGMPLSVVAQAKGVLGFFDITARDYSGYPINEGKIWFTFPVGAALVYDAPMGLSAQVFAGYDPITGLVSVFSSNVHQAWELGAGATWQPLTWLAVDASLTRQATNIDNRNVWSFATTSLQAGARIDFAGL